MSGGFDTNLVKSEDHDVQKLENDNSYANNQEHIVKTNVN